MHATPMQNNIIFHQPTLTYALGEELTPERSSNIGSDATGSDADRRVRNNRFHPPRQRNASFEDESDSPDLKGLSQRVPDRAQTNKNLQ